jgi:prevent-host-death family protein
MDEIGIERARNLLGEIVDKARFTNEPTAITRQGKPAVIVVSAKWYDATLDYIDRTVRFADYEVHHKDGDARNNDPANLELRERPAGSA